MNNEELTQAIEDIANDFGVFVYVWDDELTIDGKFTPDEIVAIAELLKKEGRV